MPSKTHTQDTHTQVRETNKKKDRTGVVEKDKYICVVKIPSPHLSPASLFPFLPSHNLIFLLPHTFDLPPLIGCVKFLFCWFIKRKKKKKRPQLQSWRWRCSIYRHSWRMSSVFKVEQEKEVTAIAKLEVEVFDLQAQLENELRF